MRWISYGIAIGSFWGIVGVFLYTPFEKLKWKSSPFWSKARYVFVVINQFAFNFIGAFFGWYSFYNLIKRSELIGFDGINVFLLVIAILGLSGKLSTIIWELPNSIGGMFSAISRKFIDKTT
jgi:hypothetical protein